MSDQFHPAIAGAIGSQSLVDEAIKTDDALRPTVRQYNIVADNYVVLAASDSPIEQQFMVGQVLDPSDYQEQFPNWIERIQKGFMLVRWTSHVDPEGDLGWFARSKMLPLSDEEADVIYKWLEGGNPHINRPDFLVQRYEEYHDELSELAPDSVGKSATCGQCGSRNVKIFFAHSAYVSADASQIEKDGETVYIATGHHEIKCQAVCQMQCLDCEATYKLDSSDFKFERDSVIGQIVDHPH